jgi:FimV-like protein
MIDISKTSLIFIIDFLIIFFAIFLIYKRMSNKKSSSDNMLDNKKPTTVITSRDIRAIAGDDMMVTQLDLARAYIELGKKKLAKQILDHVIKHGNPVQQQSARQLMASF